MLLKFERKQMVHFLVVPTQSLVQAQNGIVNLQITRMGNKYLVKEHQIIHII